MTTDHAILESISDGVFTVDMDFRITYLNRSAKKILGVSPEEAQGKLCCDVFRSSLCEGACALRKTLEANTPIIDLNCFIIDNHGQRIPVSISTAVLRDEAGNIIGGAETFRDLSDYENMKKELYSHNKFGNFSSHSPSMSRIFSSLEAIAKSNATLLITGETGTGKELLARTIHLHSNRKDKPFIAVNCGAFPESLLESELFGYRKGAFTGADRDKPGRFALAEGGTLFLDEIGEITPAMQIRLLRVIQERVYEPLGSTSGVKTDLRILAATHRNLDEMVKNGHFRQDFYYRINVIHLELPPLRERKEDIPFLIRQFIDRFNLTRSEKVSGISNSALKRLMNYNWPGNIRELENIIERAMVFCNNKIIEVGDLPDSMTAPNDYATASAGPIQKAVECSERQAIRSALKECNGNRRKAAEMLGIDHTTFYRKIKRLGITLEMSDGRRKH